MMPAYYLPETAGAGMPRQHDRSPAASPSIQGLSHSNVDHQQAIIANPEQRTIGTGTNGQPGLRMGAAHPAEAGTGFINFEAMCGAAHGASARSQVLTPGYYPYRPSDAPLYPFAVMAQNSVGVAAATAAAAAAVARSAGGGLEQERLGNANRSVELLRSAAGPGAPPTAMEPAWGGVQYASTANTTVGAWPGLSVQGPSWNVAFSTAAAPLRPISVASAALQLTTSPATAATAATAAAAIGGPSSTLPTLPASPAAASLAIDNTARVAPSVTNLRGSRPGALSSSSLREQTQLTAAASTPPSGRDAGTRSQEQCKSAAAPPPDGSEAIRAKRSKTATADNDEAGDAAGKEERTSGGDDDDHANCNGGFETDCLGKRRRLTAEERLQRSRERNQLHARKTRQRKKAQLQLLMKRSAELQAEQQRLRQAITDRRTASILLGMSGSDDVQGADGKSHKSKASRDHPPALVSMSGRTPRVGMLSALESDDTGDGSGKGNGSDDLGSESTAGTSCSASSSGRTSSEANSSDGAVGGSQAHKLPKVGNPGDTERLLELSQKTRSECTPEELEQIRRERNRMHAKRTRDRKKLHLEATEGVIARLEQENQKLRHSMKAMGSGGTGGGAADPAPVPTVSASVAAPQSTASPKPEACVPASYPRYEPALPPPTPSSVYPASTTPPQPPVTTPQQQPQQERPYPSHHHPFMHHQAAPPQGSHLKQHKRHPLQGGPVVPQHAYPTAQHHHRPHGAAQHLVQQQPSVPHTTHSQPQAHMTGFYSHGYTAGGGAAQGPAGGMASGVGGVAAGGSPGATAGLVKSEMNSYAANRHMSAMGFMGHSNPHLPTQQQMLAYQGSAAFAPPLGKTPPHMMATASPAGPQQQQHVYPVPEPRGYKAWDALGQAQAAQIPHLSYAHTHGHGYGHGTGGQMANFAAGWGPGAGTPGIGAGASTAGVEGMGAAMPGTMQRMAAAAAAAYLMQHLSCKLAPSPASSILGAEPPPPAAAAAAAAAAPSSSSSSGGNTQDVDRRHGSARVISEAQNWGACATTSVHTVMSISGTNCSRNSRNVSSSTGDSGMAGGAKSSLSGNKSSSSAAGNGPARHLARARADQKARAEKAAAEAAAAAAAASGAAPPVETEQEVARQKDQTAAAEAAADDGKSNKLDRDLSRGCQAAWEHLRRERSVKRKHTFAAAFAAAAADGSGSDRRSQSESAGSKLAASSPSMDYGSESNAEDGSSVGEGSVGEGSVASASSCSSWGENEESSLLPGSTGSSEEGQGRHIGSNEDGQGRHSGSGSDDGMSRRSFSESGSVEVGRMSGGGERERETKRRRGRMTSDKLARRCV